MIDEELVKKDIKCLELSISTIEECIKELRKELKKQRRRLRDQKIIYWQAGGKNEAKK